MGIRYPELVQRVLERGILKSLQLGDLKAFKADCDRVEAVMREINDTLRD